MRNLRRHANALTQRGVRVDRLADVHGICAHLNRQRDLSNHVARMRADHAAAQDLTVAMSVGPVVKQQLGATFVAAIRYGAAGFRSGEQALLDLDALHLRLVFGEANPGNFGVGVGHGWNDAGVEGSSGQFLVAL